MAGSYHAGFITVIQLSLYFAGKSVQNANGRKSIEEILDELLNIKQNVDVGIKVVLYMGIDIFCRIVKSQIT